jgi:hypothetical protein
MSVWPTVRPEPSRDPFTPRPNHKLNQADTVRRVPLTLETMAGSPDRLLGLFDADPEMSGDAVHYQPERVLISERASLCGTKPARLDAGADLAMVGAAGGTLLIALLLSVVIRETRRLKLPR